MNLTFSLSLYKYVRHGRTKIVSTKPAAPKPAGGLLGGQPMAPGPGALSFVDTRLCRSGLARTNRSTCVPAPHPVNQGLATLGGRCALSPTDHEQANSCRRPDRG